MTGNPGFPQSPPGISYSQTQSTRVHGVPWSASDTKFKMKVPLKSLQSLQVLFVNPAITTCHWMGPGPSQPSHGFPQGHSSQRTTPFSSTTRAPSFIQTLFAIGYPVPVPVSTSHSLTGTLTRQPAENPNTYSGLVSSSSSSRSTPGIPGHPTPVPVPVSVSVEHESS